MHLVSKISKLSVIGILMLINPFSVFSQQKPSKDAIVYQNDSTLKWKDFKGRAPGGTKTLNVLSFVYTQSGMEPNTKTNSIDLTVKAIFEPRKSYYSTKSDTTKYVLKHEQVHFDIIEIWCRITRKELMEEFKDSFVNYEKRFFKIVNKNQRLCEKMNADYDKETTHGLNMAAQKEWNQKVKKLLEEYQDFADPVVSISLN